MPLTLIRIIPSRRQKNLFWLIFSDKSKIPLSGDDYLKFRLKKSQPLSENLFEEIKTASLFYLLYNYALRQVALSPKIDKIILPKLKQKLYYYQHKYTLDGDFSFLPDNVLSKLKTHNLLKEDDFIEYLIRKYQCKPQNYLRQKLALYSLKLPPDFNKDESILLQKLLTQKKYQHLNWSDPAAKNKIIASLYRKGFAYNDIKTAIDELAKTS